MIQMLVRSFPLLHSDEDGQTIVEYALILVLVSIAAVGLLASIGDFPYGVFSDVNGDL